MNLTLVIQTLLPAALTGAFIFVERKIPGWEKLSYRRQQIIIGIAFGLAAIYATETGPTIVDGGVLNVRDAAPVVAGLAFGGPAAIIAGFIGGVERWFCVLWGGGVTTRLACSIATFASGIIAALMRSLLFENKRPVLGYALGAGVVIETFHMLLILLTNLGNITVAFEYVRTCTFTMTTLNGIACGLAFIGQTFLERGQLFIRPPHIINDLGARLFVAIMAAFASMLVFTLLITDLLSYHQAYRVLSYNADDLDIEVEKFGLGDLMGTGYAWRIEGTGSAIIYDVNTGNVESDYFNDDQINNVLSTNVEELAYDDCDFVYINGERCYVTRHALKTVNYESVLYLPESEADAVPSLMLFLVLYMEILVLATLFVALHQLIRFRVVKNLRFIEHGLDEVAAGNLDTRINVETHQEFKHLSKNLNDTIVALKGYIDEAEHRHDTELALAQQIQHSALPSVFPPFPDHPDFDLYASMNAAREVGGDFYDFFMLDSHTLVFLIADVSGKGVPAALFMMKAKIEIHSLMEASTDVAEAFTEVNRRLCEANDSGMFVTAWMGKLDLSTGELTFANAGHNPPLIKRANGKYEYLRVERPNFFLAGMEGIRYRKNRLNLYPGDKIYLYTDGVTEACDIDDRLFGEERLLTSLNNLGEYVSPQETCEAISKTLRIYAAGAEQSDDITMLSVGVDALCDSNRIITRADKASIKVVESFFEARLPKLGASTRLTMRAMVVADEIYSNICNYSGATQAVATIINKGSEVLLEFVDNGAAFDPCAVTDADTSLSAEERKIGGLGIHMVRRMSRSMEYMRVDEANVLSILIGVD